MADEQVTVEWIATQQQVLKAFETLNKRLDTQDQKLHKIGQTSKQTAQIAAGSFAALEKELKDNEKALARMQMGTAEFAAQKRKVDALRKSVRAASADVRGVGAAASGIGAAAGQGLQSIGRMAAGMIGLHATITAIVAELDKAAQIKIKTAGIERTLEQSLADIALNLGEENMVGARDKIRQGALDVGTTQQAYAQMIGDAISAGGAGFTMQDAQNVVADAMATAGGNTENAGALAGGALDIATLMQSKNYQGALGQISQIQSLVRATDPGQFAQNIGGALASASAERQNIDALTTEQAFERAAVISQLTKDQGGAITATGLRQYFGRLDRFAPVLEKTLKDKSVSKLDQATIDAFKAERSVGGREEMLRSNEALRLQFIDTIRESETKAAVVELISGSKRAMDIYTAATDKITDLDTAVGTFQGNVRAIEKETGLVKAHRFGKAAEEFASTEGDVAIEGQAREIFERVMTGVDLPGIDTLRVPKERAMLEGKLQSGMDPLRAVFMQIENAVTARGLGERDISALGRSKVDAALEEIKMLQREQLRRQVERENQKVIVQAPAPPVRPQDAPLPATTLDQ